MSKIRFNSELQREQQILVPWVREALDYEVKEDFEGLSNMCEKVRAAVHHENYGDSTFE